MPLPSLCVKPEPAGKPVVSRCRLIGGARLRGGSPAILSEVKIDGRVSVGEHGSHVTFNGLNGKFAVWDHMIDEGRIFMGSGLTDNRYVYRQFQYRCFLRDLNKYLLSVEARE